MVTNYKVVDVKTVLIVEADPDVREFLAVALQTESSQIEYVNSVWDLVERVEMAQCQVDLVLIDYAAGLVEAVKRMQEARPGLPVLIMASKWDLAGADACVRSGATAVISKPLVYDEMKNSVCNALHVVERPASPVSRLTTVASLTDGPVQSAWTRKVAQILESMRHSDVPVLLQGETGAGKEVLARQVHETSQRAKKPFLKLNCAALPAELIESELFGYERGAFTGAFKSTPGKFELANGGTILLDEIGDMDVRLQAKLLQVLQDREFLRLGARETSRVDVRIIAATHRNLEDSIESGQFREDLYYRLNVITITIPALRERRDEILSIAEFLLERHSPSGQARLEIGPGLQQALLHHDWPGNIRELENTMRRYLVVRNEKYIIEELENKVRRKAKRTMAADVCGPSRENASLLAEQVPHFSVSWPTVTPPFEAPGLPQPTVEMPPSPLPSLFTPAEPERSVAAAAPPASVVSSVAAAPVPLPSQEDDESLLTQVDDARRQAEIRVIVNTLNATLWNRKQAARVLKLDYKALLYKMKKLHIGEQPGVEQAEAHGAGKRS